jgi:hypothetical protein
MTEQGEKKIISRVLIYACYGGFRISDEALELYYGEDYINKHNIIHRNDPLRKDPKFYDVIQQLGVSKTFNPYGSDLAFQSGGCPIMCVEYYTHSSPNVIPFDLWFTPVIHEYDGLESVREIRMLTPQIEYMKKIQQSTQLTAAERCLKYEEILSLDPPIIQHTILELDKVISDLKM